jgi:TRAP transporter 4TM/12TM fusion protein
VKFIIHALAVALTAGVLAWAGDLVRMVGLLVFVEQYIAVLVAIALPLVYLSVPARRAGILEGEDRRRLDHVPWYDQLAAAAGTVTALYIAVRFPILSEEISQRPWDGMIAAVVICLLFLEGLRRTSGIAIALVAVAFFMLALAGHLLPDFLAGRRVQADRLTYFLVWDASAILGTPMQIITTIVVTFVFFGQALFKTGGSAFFTDISMALMGRYRGGPGKIAIMASSLFGTISGSPVANVVTTGVVTIPMMKRAGFRPQLAGAIEAVSSTGGQLMPPVMGIAAFLMAEFLQVSYASVVLAALVPAVLFYVALFLQADLEAARSGLRGLTPDEIPKIREILITGWHFPLPFAVLIFTLFWLNYQPEMAALAAAAMVIAASLAFGFRGKRLGGFDLYAMFRDTGMVVIDLFMIGAAAGAVIACLNYSGLGFSLTLALVHLAGGNLIALLAIAAIACILLGMGMPTVGVYILLATLVAPALIEMKVEPMAAHLFILYFGCLSMITPPVCIAAFAAANIARADPIKTGFEAVRFGWLVFVIPFLFVFSNTLLLRGDPVLIAIDVAAALVGVWFGAVGVIGYSVRRLGFAARGVYLLAGISLLMPLEAFGGGRWVNLFGGCLALTILVRERILRTRGRDVPVERPM